MKPIGQHIEVTGPLQEVIRYFYCVQTPSDFERIEQHLSPNLEMMLVFNFGDPVRMSFADNAINDLVTNRVAVLGPLRKMLNYEVLPNTDLVIAVFNINGFYRLFQLPMDEMQGNEILDPDAILQTSAFNDLWKALKNLPLLTDRIKLLEECALAYIYEEDDAMNPLLNGISYFNNPLIQPVRAIALDADVSERTIQSRFRKYLGYSPKELMRFIRFKQVIHSIQHQESNEVDWYELIEEFGYHDQSHLIKDFHHYLGTTPQKFVKEIAGKQFCVSRPVKYYS